VVSGFACGFAHVTAIATVGAIPLLLFIPGFALVNAVDPDCTVLSGGRRVMWSVVTSITLVVVGGLILNEVASLNRTSWSILIVLFVAVCTGASRIRDKHRNLGLSDSEDLEAIARGNDPATLGTRVVPGPNEKRIARRPIPLRCALLLAAAVGLVVGAVALSQNSVTASNPKFVELWMVPSPLAEGASAHRAQLGVENLVGMKVNIVVRLYEGKHRLVSRWPVTLTAGSIWSRSVARQSTESLVATICYTSDPTRVVRYVDLTSPVS
jgi:hypothetical protein